MQEVPEGTTSCLKENVPIFYLRQGNSLLQILASLLQILLYAQVKEWITYFES